MSTALATTPYRPARTERVRPLPTEAYRPVVGPPPPVWAEQLEHGIRVLGRLGCSPTPTIVLGFVLILGSTFR